jgi:hypothetical protein
MSPWYKMDKKILGKFKLEGLLHLYCGSIYLMLATVYPEYDWMPWKFRNFPARSIQGPEMIENSLKYIETESKIMKSEDWYSISGVRLQELGVKSLIDRHGGLVEVLRKHRKGFDWSESHFIGFSSSNRKTDEAT